MQAGLHGLAKLTIPRDGGNLELDLAESPDLENFGLAESLQWLLVGQENRRKLSLPRELLITVQLCPWKCCIKDSSGSSTTWAVQGLLVLSAPEGAAYHRVPILLTSDFCGAAKLMRELARTLEIPYLFSADVEGWKAEAKRAVKRPR